MAQLQSMVAEVLLLAEHGLHPVRLHYPIFTENGVQCSCRSDDCPSSSRGKHPVGMSWGKTASTDPEFIRSEWGKHNWNVGIILGLGHGIDPSDAIVDFEDDSQDGRDLAEALLGDYPTPTYSSGKSLHRLYRWHPDLPDVANFTYQGLEFRFGKKEGESQSVAPPSMHHSGVRYQWLPGKSLTDLPISTIPDHVITFIKEKWTEWESERRTHGTAGDVRKFRSPLGKVTPGGRHHALLKVANNYWRTAFKLYGWNGMQEQESMDQVWMWLAGANLLVCDPPKTEREVQVIYDSSRQFMLAEIQKEMHEAEKLATAPTAAEEEISEADDRSLHAYLHRYGIRIDRDPSLEYGQQSSLRIDQYAADWETIFLNKGEQDLVKVRICDTWVTMTVPEFTKHESFARRVQIDSQGQIILNRTFPGFSWKRLFLGGPNDKKGEHGITRGLLEWLETRATVEEQKELTLHQQVDEVVLSLAGPQESLVNALNTWNAKAQSGSFYGRLKLSPGRNEELITVRAPEDPQTGWYSVANAGVMLMVKLDEVVKKFRNIYGNSVANRKIAEVMTELGYEEKRFSRGPHQGRWWCRKNTEKILEPSEE